MALSPAGVSSLLKAGFKGIHVEKGAGSGAKFTVCTISFHYSFNTHARQAQQAQLGISFDAWKQWPCV